ncbi:aspartate--tRNA ligase msd1, partial [Spiromyces aspiralis]
LISESLGFVTMRDIYGTVQVVVQRNELGQDPEIDYAFTQLKNLPIDSLVQVHGRVRARPSKDVKGDRPADAVEVVLTRLAILNQALPLPFNPNLEDEALVPSKGPDDKSSRRNLPNEMVRLRHRHLDLRRSQLQSNLRTRSNVSHAIRNHLWSNGFIDIETPLLFKSTPEGAREFLVPTRFSCPSSSSSSSSLTAETPSGGNELGRVMCYALPQSPQQFKQMLMAAGYDRYYQIARCFRDEDLRADRQPEFTQIDLEMSFVSAEDVQKVIEDLMVSVWREAKGVELATPFPRISYKDAISRYGSDKPDT